MIEILKQYIATLDQADTLAQELGTVIVSDYDYSLLLAITDRVKKKLVKMESKHQRKAKQVEGTQE